MDIYKYPSVTEALNSSQPDRVEVHFTGIDLSSFLPLHGLNRPLAHNQHVKEQFYSVFARTFWRLLYDAPSHS